MRGILLAGETASGSFLADHREAMRKMTSGRAKVVFRKSLYAPLLFRLELKAVPQVPTMCTDGRSLMFNPGFVLELHMGHLMFGILHEVLHCVLHHPARRGSRDPVLWNIACDLLVNAILVFEEKMIPPPGAILDAKYWKKEDGSRWTVDEIYDDLAKDAEGAKKRYVVKHPCVWRDPTTESVGRRKDASEEEKSGGNAKDSEDGGAGSSRDRVPVESGHEDHAFSDPRGWDVPWDKDLEETWKQAAIQMDQMARMRGTVPGWLSKLVEELVEPPVPIERILQFIAGSVASDEVTWKNPNRRFISRGIHLPSTLKDRKDVVFVVDTSGSISDEEIGNFFGIMSRAFRLKGIHTLRVIQCDAQITDDTVCRSWGELRVHVLKTGAKGRRGTSFVPPFEKLRREHAEWRVSCLVYLTDLMGDFPDRKPPYPVYWVSVRRDKAPFGRTYYWDRKSNRVEVVRGEIHEDS